MQIVLQPAERRRMLFVLGHGSDTADAERLIGRHANMEAALAVLAKVETSWNTTLGAIQVHTPRAQLRDVMALLFARPDLAREHLLRAAAHAICYGCRTPSRSTSARQVI